MPRTESLAELRKIVADLFHEDACYREERDESGTRKFVRLPPRPDACIRCDLDKWIDRALKETP